MMPQLDCSSCTDQQKKTRGCEAPPPLPMMFDGQPIDRCPMRPYFEEPYWYNTLMERYRWVKDGFLPDPGLLPDQATAFLTYKLVIDLATNEADHQEQEKREKEQRMAEHRSRMKGSKPGGRR